MIAVKREQKPAKVRWGDNEGACQRRCVTGPQTLYLASALGTDLDRKLCSVAGKSIVAAIAGSDAL